jgi:hypothetical protein
MNPSNFWDVYPISLDPSCADQHARQAPSKTTQAGFEKEDFQLLADQLFWPLLASLAIACGSACFGS